MTLYSPRLHFERLSGYDVQPTAATVPGIRVPPSESRVPGNSTWFEALQHKPSYPAMIHDLRSLEPALKYLLDGLSTTDTTYAAANDRAERYARSLENDRDFGVVGTRIGGSIGKGTAIAPLSDVDLYVYLSQEHWRTSRREALLPSTVIGRLRARIVKRLHFEISEGHVSIRSQKHSVGIRFRKPNSVGIDVVPALVENGDASEALIPRRGTDEFVETSVERQIDLIKRLDSPFRYLRRGIRLLKFWNRQTDVGLHSYAVEVLGMHAVHRDCKRTDTGVFLSALRFIAATDMRSPVYIDHFFRFSPRARRSCIIMDPAMPNNNLGELLDARDGYRLGAAARSTLRKLDKAADFADRGNMRISAECLSEAFGQPRLFR
ncbi:nucleotidyltransferase [Nannocystis sp. RBIL2]|uniref:nucleotidyltransferase domain-containing protein n=1 Tax=Nannocystis sp. RBIL2 TaxID=2996788 RepID=UPI00226F48EA|nr:nucleotidyltransferase [Nannocystis sp. RBIL2]MCY1071197.1 nucleotidyltransferase [Nannocystis sp. RBIL2]